MREFDLDFPQRTDLADESTEYIRLCSGKSDTGLCTREETLNGFSVHTLEVLDERGEAASGKPTGTYITVDVGKIWNSDKQRFRSACSALAQCVRSFIPPKTQSCLLAALGNRAIIADAIGPITAENFIVTRHIRQSDPDLFDSLLMRETVCICPGVLGSTGIEAAEIIRGAVSCARPDLVIAVDSLASRRLSRLATTVQICNTGIAPGSGIYNARKELTARTLGVPVIAVGVPTVVEVTTLAAELLRSAAEKTGNLGKKEIHDILDSLSEQDGEGFFVTPKETDHIIKDTAKLIGYGLNLALHDSLSFDEIDEFLS